MPLFHNTCLHSHSWLNNGRKNTHLKHDVIPWSAAQHAVSHECLTVVDNGLKHNSEAQQTEDNCEESHDGTKKIFSCLSLPGIVGARKSIFIEGISEYFGKYAEFVYDRPWIFIILPMLVSLALGYGVLSRQYENEMLKLYSLRGSESLRHKEDFLSFFSLPRQEVITLSSNTNQLTKEMLQKIDSLEQKIESLTVSRDAVKRDEFDKPLPDDTLEALKRYPEIIKFEDVCSRDSRKLCSKVSVTDFYLDSRLYGNPLLVFAWPLVYDFFHKRFLPFDIVLGNVTTSKKIKNGSENIVVTDATAFSIQYELLNEGDIRHFSSAFEVKIAKLLDEVSIEGVEVSYKMERSVNDELQRSSTIGKQDWLRLLGGIGLLALYSGISKSSFSHRTKTLPVLIGVFSAILGYMGGAGMVYLLGARHTPPAEATPFLIIGIGADSCFVLIDTFTLTYLCEDPKERMRATVQSAGLSITLTTTTSLLAFLIGIASPYYAVSQFCIITAASLFMSYTMCLTFFLGVLCLDSWREHYLLSSKKEINLEPLHTRTFFGLKMHAAAAFGTAKKVHCSIGEKSTVCSSKISKNRLQKKKQSKISSSNFCDDSTSSLTSSVHNASLDEEEENIGIGDPLHIRDGGSSGEGAVHGMKRKDEFLSGVSIYFLAQKLVGYLLAEINSKKKLRISQGKGQYLAVFEARLNQFLGSATTYFAEFVGINQRRTDKKEPSYFEVHLEHPSQAGVEQLAIIKDISDCATQTSARKSSYQGSTEENADESSRTRESDCFPEDFFREPNHNVGKKFRMGVVAFYNWLLTSKIAKLVLGLVLCAVLSTAVVGLCNLDYGLSLRDITTKDSFLNQFYDAREAYFPAYGEYLSVLFSKKVDWHNAEVQKSLLNFQDNLISSGFATSPINGMHTFLTQSGYRPLQGDLANSTVEFYERLSAWLDTSIGLQFKHDFILDDAAQAIVAWKFHYWLPNTDDTMQLNIWITKARNLLEQDPNLATGKIFGSYSAMWESDPIILAITLQNVTYALLAIFLVCAVLITNLSVVALAIATVSLINFCLLGFMSIWNLKLNMLTMVNLLLSVGYSVDYSLHMLHTFTRCEGRNGHSSVLETLIIMALPLTDGVISTFSPVTMLATSEKVALSIFFKMITMVLIFAYAQGMLFIPLMLHAFSCKREI